MQTSTGISLKSIFRSSFFSSAAYASSVAGSMAMLPALAPTSRLSSMVMGRMNQSCTLNVSQGQYLVIKEGKCRVLGTRREFSALASHPTARHLPSGARSHSLVVHVQPRQVKCRPDSAFQRCLVQILAAAGFVQRTLMG